MLMVPSFTHCFIFRFAFNRSRKIAILDQWSMANFNSLIHGYFFVLNKAVFLERVITFFFLNSFKIWSVSCLAFLFICVMAFNLFILDNLFNILNLVHTSFSSFGNGVNIQGRISLFNLVFIVRFKILNN